MNGQTLQTDIMQESAYKWKGKIALINATDYVRASTNSNCTDIYAYANTSSCYSNSEAHNYLFRSTSELTLSPYSYSETANAWGIGEGGNLYDNQITDWHKGFESAQVFSAPSSTRPSFYLKNNIEIIGTGSSEDPYCVEGLACSVHDGESDESVCGDAAPF